MDIEGAEQGVIVTAVQPNGIAARLDIHPGDRVVRVNGEPVKTVRELLTAINVNVINGKSRWPAAAG